MKSKISFINKGILFDDIRRFGWVSVVYTLALFFIVPLKIFMLQDIKEVNNNSANMVDMFYFRNTPIQSLLTLIIPVMLAVFLFRYMMIKNSCDMIHSLPIKRNVLYRSHIVFGIVTLIVPVLVNSIIVWSINIAFNLGKYYSTFDIWQWIGITILFNLVFFFVSVCVGMITGSSIVHGVLTYIFLFLPFGFMVLMTYNLKTLLYGFVYNLGNTSNMLSPMVRILDGFGKYNKMTSQEVFIYIALCIGLYILSQFVYNKRRLETTSQSIAFYSFQYIFKYGVTFCTMLLTGVYFQHTQNNIKWILIGYVVGSLVGYFIAEMIIKKSLWVLKSAKGYAVYAAVIIVVVLGVRYDLIGYEKRIPALIDVSSVYFSEGLYNPSDRPADMDTYSKSQDIQNVYNFHKLLISQRSMNKYSSKKPSRNIVFVYHLKDGKSITRGYTLYENYVEYFKPIMESMQYKNSHYGVLRVDTSDVEKISITPSMNSNKVAVIIKPEDIKEGLDVLKQDILNIKYEDMNAQMTPWANIHLTITDNKINKYSDPLKSDFVTNTDWKKSYKLFEAWLDKKGYLKNSRILPEDIGFAVVEKVKSSAAWDAKMKSGTFIDDKNVKRLDIKDKNQLEECLKTYKYPWRDETEQYIIGFYRDDKAIMDWGRFDESSAPAFVKNYFK